MTSYSRSRFEYGLAPDELWGKSRGRRAERTRGAEARARRRARRAAKALGVTLKSYLRKENAAPPFVRGLVR